MPPRCRWRPEFTPITRETIDPEATARSKSFSGYVVRAMSTKQNHAARSDAHRQRSGTALAEADQPKDRFMRPQTLIRAWNSSGGRCTICGKTMVMMGQITTRRQARELAEGLDAVDYSQQMDVWTVQRKRNFLHHLESNILPGAICNFCNVSYNTNEVSQERCG